MKTFHCRTAKNTMQPVFWVSALEVSKAVVWYRQHSGQRPQFGGLVTRLSRRWKHLLCRNSSVIVLQVLRCVRQLPSSVRCSSTTFTSFFFFLKSTFSTSAKPKTFPHACIHQIILWAFVEMGDQVCCSVTFCVWIYECIFLHAITSLHFNILCIYKCI